MCAKEGQALATVDHQRAASRSGHSSQGPNAIPGSANRVEILTRTWRVRRVLETATSLQLLLFTFLG